MANNKSFASYAELSSYCAMLSRAIGVHPNTNAIRGGVKLGIALEKNAAQFSEWYGFDVTEAFMVSWRSAHNGVMWARNTGRLRHEAEDYIKGLTAYKYNRLLLNFALKGYTMADVCEWLNGGKPEGKYLPIE